MFKKTIYSLSIMTGVVASPIIMTMSCSGNSGSKEVAIIVSTKTNPYFQTMVDAAKSESAKYTNESLQVYDSENNTAKELANVKAAIANGAKVILINVVNSKTNNAVKYAEAKGIKVIALDRKVDNAKVQGSIYTDNVKASKSLGIAVVTYIKEQKNGINFSSSNALQLRGMPGSASTARNEGFPKGFTQWTGITVQKAGFNRTKGYSTTKTLIGTNESLNVIYAENDEMALGAVRAFKEKYKEGSLLSNHILIAGFDGTSDGLRAVQSGDMFATVQQRPDNMGAWGFDWAMKLLGKKNVKHLNELNKAVDKNLAINGKVILKK